ncbi:hypothetical protein [Priestia koreensis]|uniref:hypothetical protein n=1 Tax=Priestia koreensis TaxID=284581 RepID=UPI0028F71AE8|nr:hypothetical protein [Priestia koreensis]
MKKVIIGAFAIGIITLVLLKFDHMHVSAEEAISHENDVKTIESKDIKNYGKIVLFEDETFRTFGISRLERKFGFLYRSDGGTFGYSVEAGKPFKATGMGDHSRFVVAIETAPRSKIQYIALGNHLKGVSQTAPYHLSLNDVKSHSKVYHVQKVKNRYALFVLNKYTESNWNIRAFDKKGRLVADKLFAGEARYVNWK